MKTLDQSKFRQERGSTVVSYAGILWVVVMIILCILLVVGYSGTSFGSSLVCKIASAISQMGGGHPTSCASSSASSPPKNPQEPTKACTNNETSDQVSANVGFGKITVEANGAIVVEEMSDGTYRVTDKSGGAAKFGPGVSGGLEVNAGGKKYGGYLDAGANAGIANESGYTYVVNSEKEKNDLVSYLTRKKTVDAAGAGVDATANHGAQGIGSWVSGMANGAADMFDKHVLGYVPPEPSEIYVEGGVTGSASASLTSRHPFGKMPVEIGGVTNRSDGDAGVEVKGLAGVRENMKEKTRTFYYKPSVKGGAGVTDDQAQESGKANAYDTTNYAVTYDTETGDVINVSTSIDMGYETASSEKVREVYGNYDGKSDVRYVASVDVNDPESRSKTEAFLKSVGIPTNVNQPPSAPNGNPITTFDDFQKHAKNHGVFTRQDIDRNDTEYGAKGALEVSAGAAYTRGKTHFSNGEWYDSKTGEWHSWKGCE